MVEANIAQGCVKVLRVEVFGSNGEGYHTDVWTYRKELVDYIRIMCQRNGWKFRNPGGDEPKIARGEQMNDFYASAKVTIGDSLCLKKENSHYWSDRGSLADDKLVLEVD